MSSKIQLKLGPSRAYDITVGSGLMRGFGSTLKSIKSRNAFIVYDRSLKLHLRSLHQGLSAAGWSVREIPVEAGETLKDFKNTFPIYGKLLKGGAHRDATLFALGGGSVGDAAGFVASTYLRGIDWVGVPTTLLAQVDSAIGGKTAVNHTLGKNLVGSFHQPAAVICDVDFLKTLSEREMISGLGEAIKYGLVYDLELYRFIQKNWKKAVQCDAKVLTHIVEKSVHWKAQVVARDEFDRKGVREFLNFGHTLGHALEEATDYKTFQHGEAVILGMRFALALSQTCGKLPSRIRNETEKFLAAIPIPKWPAKIKFERILQPLSKDKKIRDGKLNFVLLKDFMKPFSYSEVTQENLRDAYRLLTGREK